MFEKLCTVRFGVNFNCLFVKFAKSTAIIRAVRDTIRALNFRVAGIVIIGVFVGRKFEVIIIPAMILPQARRLIGFKIVWLFSLIIIRGSDRGFPIEVKKIIRRL